MSETYAPAPGPAGGPGAGVSLAVRPRGGGAPILNEYKSHGVWGGYCSGKEGSS